MIQVQALSKIQAIFKLNVLLTYVSYLAIGFFFGFVLIKAEVISWYRIQEMFRFQSFHMYGIISSAIVVGMISIWLIRHFRISALNGENVTFTPKARTYPRYIIGGTIFGLGWSLTGACPGPILALIGGGMSVLLVVLASALLGTWFYGAMRTRLPH